MHPSRNLKISARDAALELLALIPDATKIEERLRKSIKAELSDRERTEVQNVIGETIGEAFQQFVFGVRADTRLKRTGSGRQGAPSRDRLRRSIRALRSRFIDLVDEADESKAMRCIALLILLYGIDSHGTFWRREGAPPAGRDRVRWLVRRLTDLHDEGDGQYVARRSKRGPLDIQNRAALKPAKS